MYIDLIVLVILIITIVVGSSLFDKTNNWIHIEKPELNIDLSKYELLDWQPTFGHWNSTASGAIFIAYMRSTPLRAFFYSSSSSSSEACDPLMSLITDEATPQSIPPIGNAIHAGCQASYKNPKITKTAVARSIMIPDTVSSRLSFLPLALWLASDFRGFV